MARTEDARLKRLAQSIDALAEKDQGLLSYTREMAGVRRRAAWELHSICAEFVVAVNRLLSRSEIALDPPDFPEDAFHDEGVHLLQINSRGRILQIEFEATPELVSTEDFRIPYTLQGTIRAFNQQFLEQHLIEEQLVFYTIEKKQKLWRYFDARTQRSGPFDREYLVDLMEQLI